VPTFSVQASWNLLISGYLSLLVYPILLLIVFFMLGRRLNGTEDGLFGFATSVFIAGTAGFLVGVIVSGFLAAPSTLPEYFLHSNLARFVVDSVIAGVFVLIISFAAASIGFIRKVSVTHHITGDW
jgi:hypothetical protein